MQFHIFVQEFLFNHIVLHIAKHYTLTMFHFQETTEFDLHIDKIYKWVSGSPAERDAFITCLWKVLAGKLKGGSDQGCCCCCMLIKSGLTWIGKEKRPLKCLALCLRTEMFICYLSITHNRYVYVHSIYFHI